MLTVSVVLFNCERATLGSVWSIARKMLLFYHAALESIIRFCITALCSNLAVHSDSQISPLLQGTMQEIKTHQIH